MTPTRTVVGTTMIVAAMVLTLAGCSTDGGAPPSGEGGTFTQILADDPGNLDPQMSAGSSLFAVSRFAYDTLVGVNADGEALSQLASAWELDGMTATFTLRDGITCSDGTSFTAETAAANLNWIADPENESPFLGTFLPAGVSADAADDALTLTLASPAPFLLLGLAAVPMVCESGLADRSTLAGASSGTGPYELIEAVPNDHYTFQLREEYAWGPDGATVDEPGIPAVVKLRVVADTTTATNLLLSGEVQAAQLIGPDAERARAAALFSREATAITGEQWFNHNDGHPTSDPAVRMALTQALDLPQLAKVITAGAGGPATQLATVDPRGCTFDSVSSSLPDHDVDAANAALDAAGWSTGADGIRTKDGTPLRLVFLYQNNLGAPATAAAELAIASWREIGVEVEGKQQDESAVLDAIFTTGAWDISWVALAVNSPDQLIGFLSGPGAPEGTNFSGIRNAEYDAAVAQAMDMPGSEGCPTWQKAEMALLTAADIVPFASSALTMFGNGAEFEWLGEPQPTSIRLRG